MTEPTIICSKCGNEIKLTESLAAPLIEATKRDFETRMARQTADMTRREEQLAKAKEAMDSQFAEKLRQERTRIATEEAAKVKVLMATDLDQKAKAIQDLQEVVRNRDAKLAEADNARVELIRKKRELEDAKRQFELTVENRVQAGLDAIRVQIRKEAEEQAGKDKAAQAAALEGKATEIAALNDAIKQKEDKLAEAQKAQAEVIRKERELAEDRREMDLTIEKRIDAALGTIREKAQKEAEEGMKLKVLEKEHTIESMQKTIEELKRKADQGSQQLQGEVQELDLEALLKAKFPFDTVEAVSKGERGADVLQRVVSPTGQACGAILWESKRTKNWSDGWLPKLRDDQRAAKAEIAVIVSQALPKGIETFDTVEGVWITNPRSVLPVAALLRHALIEVGSARTASEGQQTKMELLYQYLTGPRFHQRVQAIVEAFSTMKEDLDRERKALTKQWAKREEQIERVMQGTVGMVGDLQGIAGKSLKEIEGLDMLRLGQNPESESP